MNSAVYLIRANVVNSLGLSKLKSAPKADKVKYGGFGFLILFAIASVLMNIFFLYYMLSDMLVELGMLSFLIISGFTSVSLLGIVMSVYKAPGYLYAFKDYDMLISLPIPPASVLVSKVFFLYLTNFILTLLMGGPPWIIYGIRSEQGVLFYLMMVIMMFFVPIIPMLLGSFLSLLLGRMAIKAKRSSLTMLIGSFVIVLVLMFLPSLISSINKEQVQQTGAVMNSITDYYFPGKLFVNALVEGDLFSLGFFALMNGLILYGFVAFFAKSFKKINARMLESFQGAAFKMKSLQVSTPLRALLRKEMRTYFSTNVYVLNTGFGLVMLLIFPIIVVVAGEDTLATMLEIPSIAGYLVPVLMVVVTFCVSMSYITAPSISLEGKNLWILKSLPIKPVDIFKSKILLEVVLVLPVLFVGTTILFLGLHLAFMEYFMLLLIGAGYCFLNALCGIMLNLLFPNLEWKTPTTPVKQSASVLIATFLGFGTMIVPGVLYVQFGNDDIITFSLFLFVVLVTLCGLIWTLIRTKGVQMFHHL